MNNLLLTDPKVEICRFVVVAVKSRDLQDEIEEAHSFLGDALSQGKKYATNQIGNLTQARAPLPKFSPSTEVAILKAHSIGWIGCLRQAK